MLGWGATSYGGDSSDVLLEVAVAVVTRETCSAAMSGITDTMICAGGVAGQDSCQVTQSLRSVNISSSGSVTQSVSQSVKFQSKSWS